MKIAVIYHSETGNTRQMAELVAPKVDVKWRASRPGTWR